MSKRQQNEKKPRIIELKKSDSSKLVTVHRMNIQIHPDRIEINAPEINENIEGATLTKYYYNEKGKLKRDYSISNPTLKIDENQLIEEYGIVYCCDTNTIETEIEGINYSVGVAYKIENKDGINYIAQPYYIMFWLWKKEGINIERYSWAKVIDYIINKEEKKESICMIVDSDFDELDAISAQQQPIAESFYIPKASKLVYASADRGNSWMNTVIKKCDKLSSKYLKEIYPPMELLHELNIKEEFIYLGKEFPPDRLVFAEEK